MPLQCGYMKNGPIWALIVQLALAIWPFRGEPMSNAMVYNGYSARVEYDDEDGIFFGRLTDIRDGVGFHADTRKRAADGLPCGAGGLSGAVRQDREGCVGWTFRRTFPVVVVAEEPEAVGGGTAWEGGIRSKGRKNECAG